MKILSLIILVLTLHSCTAPLYTIMPQEAAMIEETGGHAAGLSVGTSQYVLNMSQISVDYAYALPYGLRVRADVDLLAGASFYNRFVARGIERSRSVSYGLGLGYFVKLGRSVRLQTMIHGRNVNARYTISPAGSGRPSFSAPYSAFNTNLYTKCRFKVYDMFHIEVSAGYQWTYFRRLGTVSGNGAQFIADYGSFNFLHGASFGQSYVLAIDNAELASFFTIYAFSNSTTLSREYFNPFIIGLKGTKHF